MSLPRVLSPLLSSTRRSLTTPLKSRYRPSTHTLPSICSICLQRGLQTATPYRPSTLDIPTIDQAPPRNKDAPRSELTKRSTDGKPPFSAVPIDGVKDGQGPPPPVQQQQQQTKQTILSTSTLATPISKTQSPTPIQSTLSTSPSATPSTTPSSTTTTSTPRKLRPRKAAMTLTPLAITHISSLTHQTPPKLIRVGVKNKGCSGLAYNLEYIEKPGRFDEVVEQDGVKVYIDSKALFSIIGSEMDWVEDQLSARFVFKNPNIKEECGCGESFMVHGGPQ